MISADYAGISSEVTYYVPIGATYEVWRAVITNNSDKPRNLSAFGFVEFTNDNNYEQDQVNLQYTLFITRTSFEGNKILQHINENSGKDATGSNHRERFSGMVGAPISGYNGNLDSFIGPYRTYSNPIAVEQGKCTGEMNYNGNGLRRTPERYHAPAGRVQGTDLRTGSEGQHPGKRDPGIL